MNGEEIHNHMQQRVGAFVDGELERNDAFEIEEHLLECESCQERVSLERATKQSVKHVLSEKASPELHARLRTLVESEALRPKSDLAPGSWKSVVGSLAMAAAVGLVSAKVFERLSTRSLSADSGLKEIGSKDVLGDFVAQHSSPLPPERTDPKDVRAFEQYVGVPIRPALLERKGAKFLGGRVLPLYKERAAMLQYEVGSGADTRRVSMLVFDPHKIQVQKLDPTILSTPRVVGTSEVRVGRTNGYSVAVTENEGVGYVLAGDVDPDRSVELVSF